MALRVVTSSTRLSPGWPSGSALRAGRSFYRYDSIDGGRYRIIGTVAIDDSPDIPLRRQVRLFDKRTGRLVRETWSAEGTGAYAFEYIANRAYFVITHDYVGFYNAVVADGITPELMP